MDYPRGELVAAPEGRQKPGGILKSRPGKKSSRFPNLDGRATISWWVGGRVETLPPTPAFSLTQD